MSPIDWLLMVILSFLWGASFFFFKILIVELPPLTIVMLRVGLAAIVLWALMSLRGISVPKTSGVWLSFLIMGVLNNLIPFSLIIWSETQISSGLASILNATTPIFTVLLAHFFTADERLTPNRIAGVFLGFAGVIVLVGPSAVSGLKLASLAQVAVVAAAASYGCASIYARRFKALGISALMTSTGQLVASAVLITPIALAIDRPWTLAHAPTLAAWGALLGLVVLSTVLAYIIYFRILASSGATNAVLVTLLIPVSTLLLGALVLHEQLALTSMIGMLLIFSGLAAIDGRLVLLLRRTALQPRTK